MSISRLKTGRVQNRDLQFSTRNLPVEVNKRFTDMDEQEKKDKLYEDMEPELEFAFDTEEEMPEPFVTESTGNPESVAEQKTEAHISKSVGNEKDSIPYRLFHWRFTVEQKEELKRAMDARVPKEVVIFLSGNFRSEDDGDTQAV